MKEVNSPLRVSETKMTMKVVSQGLIDMDQLIKNAVKIRKVGEDETMDLGFDISMIQRDETTLLQMEEREVIRKHMISVWTDLLLERASSDDLMLSQVASLTWLVAWPELLHGISNH